MVAEMAEATPPSDAGAARIRPAAHEDLDAIRALLRATWHDTYDPLIGAERVEALTAAWHTPEHVGRLIDDPSTTYLLAEAPADGRIEGVAGALLGTDAILLVRQLYVRPGRQRAGIGGALLARLLESAPSAVEARLAVETDNGKGVAFYRKNGFEVLAEVEEDGIPTLRMRRNLREKDAR
jgi:ribosomal protein S18 acetylase RimI-like enzyme